VIVAVVCLMNHKRRHLATAEKAGKFDSFFIYRGRLQIQPGDTIKNMLLKYMVK